MSPGLRYLLLAAAAFSMPLPAADRGSVPLVVERLLGGEDLSALVASQATSPMPAQAAAPAATSGGTIRALHAAIAAQRTPIDVVAAGRQAVDAIEALALLQDARFAADQRVLDSRPAAPTLQARMSAARASSRAHIDSALGIARRAADGAVGAAELERALASLVVESSPPILATGVLPNHRPRLAPGVPAAAPLTVPSYARGDAADPVAADRAPNDDAPQTAAVLTAAGQLGFDAARIFDLVRGQIDTQWYAGSMKSPDEVLRSRAGNDVDQARLLVALLRASGFGARFVRGVVQIPARDLARQLGVRENKVEHALRAAGIAARGRVVGGALVDFEVEQHWVSAFIPFAGYRGAAVDRDSPIWVPLMPALKPYAFQPAAGAVALSGIDTAAWTDEHLAALRSEAPIDRLRQRLLQYAAAQSPPVTLDSLGPLHQNDAGSLGLIAAATAHPVLRVLTEQAQLDVGVRQMVSIVLQSAEATSPALSLALPVERVAGRRLTLAFAPATVEDQDAANAFGGLGAVPAYLIRVRAVLFVDGRPAAAGEGALNIGQELQLRVAFSAPAGGGRTTQQIRAGGYAALAISAQDDEFEAPNDATALPGDSEPAAARLLAGLGARYLQQWNRADHELANWIGVTPIRPLPSAVLTLGLYLPTGVGGIVERLRFDGVGLDAGFRPVEPIVQREGALLESDFLRLSALQASALEYRVFESQWGVESISADKALAAAPVAQRLRLSGGSSAATLTHPPAVRAAIQSWLDQGYIVDTTREPIALAAWRGSVWRAQDLASGESGWFITGGLAGGSTAVPPSLWAFRDLAEALANPYAEDPNLDPQSATIVSIDASAQDQRAAAGEQLARELLALVRDADGRPVAGARVTFEVIAGDSKLAAAGGPATTLEALTDRVGIARAGARAPQRFADLGIYEIDAQRGPNPQFIGSSIVDVRVDSARGPLRAGQPYRIFGIPGAPANLSVIREGAQAIFPAIGGRALRAVVRDQFDNEISNLPVALTVSDSIATDHPDIAPSRLYAEGSCGSTEPVVNYPAAGCGTGTREVLTAPQGARSLMLPSNLTGNAITVSGLVQGLSASALWNTAAGASGAVDYLVNQYAWLDYRGEGVSGRYAIDAAPPGEAFPLPRRVSVLRIAVRSIPGMRAVLEAAPFTGGQLTVATEGAASGPVTALGGGQYQYTLTAGAAPRRVGGQLRLRVPREQPADPDFDESFDVVGATVLALAPLVLEPEVAPLSPFGRTESEFTARLTFEPATEYVGAPLRVSLLEGERLVGAIQLLYGAADSTALFPRGLALSADATSNVVATLNEGTPYELKSPPARLRFTQGVISGYGTLRGPDLVAAPALEALISGRYPKNLELRTDIDTASRTVCVADSQLAFALARQARVTVEFRALDANGEPNAFPAWTPLADQTLSPGVHLLPISVARLPIGTYAFQIDATATADGQTERRSGQVRNLESREDALPLAHSYVKGVGVFDGNAIIAAQDFDLGGLGPSAQVERTYVSHQGDRMGVFGRGWRTAMESEVTVTSCNVRIVSGGAGQGQRFLFDRTESDGSQWFRPLSGYNGSLRLRDGAYDFYAKDGTRYHYAEGFGERRLLSWTEDTNGNRTTLAYETRGTNRVVVAQRDDDGRAALFDYTMRAFTRRVAGANVTEVHPVVLRARLPEGLQIDYAYDTAGNLTGVQWPSGVRHDAYDYVDFGGLILPDPGGQPRYHHFGSRLSVARNARNGAERRYDYELSITTIPTSEGPIYLPLQRAWRVTEPDGGQTRFAFTGTRGLGPVETLVTDARNKPSTYGMNVYGAVESLTDPVGTTRTTWDLLRWQPSEIVDPIGRITRYTYDASGNRLTERITLGGDTLQRAWTYVAPTEFAVPGIKNRERSHTDARNIVTTYAYDPRGNRTAQTRGGVTVRWTWGPQGTRDSYTTGADETWTYGYDGRGFPAQETRPLGGITRWVYDARGRKREQTDANGATTNWDYDQRDRLLSAQHPATGGARATETVAYDDTTDTVTLTDARNHVTIQRHDRMGRMIGETQATGESRVLTYDLNGNKKTETDFRGNTTSYDYDDVNRLQKRTEPLSRWTQYTYDLVGNLLRESVSKAGDDPRVTEHRYEHPLYRKTLSRRQLSADGWLNSSAEFDGNGNQTQAVDPLGRITTYAYDSRDRLETQTAPLGRVIVNAYDGADRRISETQRNSTGSGDQIRRWTYDADGRVATQTDAEGNVTLYGYDLKGNRIAQTNARGALRRWVFDARDRVVEETGPAAGQRWVYRYDDNGNRIQETQPSVPNLNQVMHTYDALDRRTRSEDSLGLVEELGYGADGHIESRANANDHETTFLIDALGRVVEERRPMARTWRQTWTIHGELESQTDPREFTTEHTYDAVGRKLQTRLPPREGMGAGGAESLSWEYDAAGSVLSTTSARGFVTTFTWDELNRKASETSPTVPAGTGSASYVRTWTYDTVGNVLTETDRRGIVSLHRGDRENRRLSSTRDDTLIERNDYDAVGNLERRTDANGRVTRTAFDLADRAVLQAVADGTTAVGTTEWTYTPLGDIATVTDPEGRRTSNAWDARRRMISSTNALAERTSFAHNGLGQVTRIEPPLGASHASTRTYDAADRLHTVSDGEGNTWTYSYNTTDQRTAILNPRGHATAFDFDGRGQMIAMTYPGGAQSSYRHDADGYRIREVTANGVTIAHTVDALGRRLSSSYDPVAAGEVTGTGYSFDGNGNQLAISDRIDATTFLTLTRRYDRRDRIAEETDPYGRSLSFTYDALGNRLSRIDAQTGQTTTYTYDPRHRNTSVSDAASGSTTLGWYADDRLQEIVRPGNVRSSYTYDRAGRTESISHRQNALELSRLDYAYDLDGNRQSEQLRHRDAGIWTTTYGYDEADRLIRSTLGNISTVYTLDAVGNRIGERRRVDAGADTLNRLCEFDDRDRMISCTEAVSGLGESATWDANGNRSSETQGAQTRTLHWDARNRLLRISPGTGSAIDYTYDPEGARIESRQGANGTRAQYDAGHRYAESNGAGQVTRQYQSIAPSRAASRGAWARAGAAAMTLFLGMTDAGAIPTPRHYLHDALSTPIAITRHDGALAQRSVYDAWGNPISQDTLDAGLESNPNRIGFTGYTLDREASTDASGNPVPNSGPVANARYYAKARYYGAGRGSFLSVDPWGGDPTSPVSLNKYLYGYGNPGIYIDPDGRIGYLTDLRDRFDRTDAILRQNAVEAEGTAGLLGYSLLRGLAAAGSAIPRVLNVASDAVAQALPGETFSGVRADGAAEFGNVVDTGVYVASNPGQVVKDIHGNAVQTTVALAEGDRGAASDAISFFGQVGGGAATARAFGLGAGAATHAPRRLGEGPEIGPRDIDLDLDYRAPEAAPRVIAESKSGDTFIGPTIGRTGFETWEEFNAEAYRRYQRYVDEAYDDAVAAEQQGLLRGNRNTRVGDFVDRQSRDQFNDWLASEGIPEGPNGSVQVNRWLRDPSGSGDYVRPDIQMPGLIMDATVGKKPPGTPQINKNAEYSGGTPTTVVRPSSLGGSCTVLDCPVP